MCSAAGCLLRRAPRPAYSASHSSPRIAALINQQAVLKVGTDDIFVTDVSTTSNTGGAGTTTTPSVTLQPFFSGIALDVTPQIDEKGRITLHIRPSVSVVTEKIKNIDAGQAGKLTLPLASSAVSETDSVVQVEDGRIVAIGGMMKQSFDGRANRVPGLGQVPLLGYFFGNTNQSSKKSELVILIKPTVIDSQADWQADAEATQARLDKIERQPATPGRQWLSPTPIIRWAQRADYRMAESRFLRPAAAIPSPILPISGLPKRLSD